MATVGPFQTFDDSTKKTPKLQIDKYFRMFPYLHDDIKVTILSYVAEAPLEQMPDNYPHAPLTHSLNRVNRNFRKWCSSDLFWKGAVVRMIQREPKLWNAALQSILLSMDDECVKTTDKDIVIKQRHDPVATCLQQIVIPTKRIPHYKALYETVVNEYLRFKGPVVFLPGQVAIGQDYELQFMECRDRVIIAEILKNTSSSTSSPVYFIHANRSPLEPTTPAVLVKILHCEMLPDGQARVQVLPFHYVWLERIWIEQRTNSEGGRTSLFFAQCLKMGRRVTDQMNRLQRQEALVHMMDHLVQQLQSTPDDEDDDIEHDSSISSSEVDDHDDGSSMDDSEYSNYASEDEYLEFPNDET